MVFRPANSPELKDLELAPFASKQSLQYNTPCNGVDELVFVVEEAFKLMRAETLNGILFPNGGSTCIRCLVLPYYFNSCFLCEAVPITRLLSELDLLLVDAGMVRAITFKTGIIFRCDYRAGN